ncbi:branched-chain amino acid ABC transporter permease [Janthinobacterium aquaticum]|nr:branched-chain amino acid ABC transporter permease [Janthinobacterium sp. FT58W]
MHTSPSPAVPVLDPAADGMPQTGKAREALRGLTASLPVMLGFVPFALVLGAQAAQKGLSVAELALMTGLNFAGGSEFAAVRLWTSPPHLLLIVGMTLLVNCRHILMGAALVPYMRHLKRRQALPALFLMCDETWALALADARARGATRLSMPYYLGVAGGLYASWVAFTALGAAIGPRMGDLEQFGFEMAFTAVFLVLLRGMWKGVRASRPWLVSLVVSAGAYLLLPGAWHVALGAVAGLVAAVLLEDGHA